MLEVKSFGDKQKKTVCAPNIPTSSICQQKHPHQFINDVTALKEALPKQVMMSDGCLKYSRSETNRRKTNCAPNIPTSSICQQKHPHHKVVRRQTEEDSLCSQHPHLFHLSTETSSSVYKRCDIAKGVANQAGHYVRRMLEVKSFGDKQKKTVCAPNIPTSSICQQKHPHQFINDVTALKEALPKQVMMSDGCLKYSRSETNRRKTNCAPNIPTSSICQQKHPHQFINDVTSLKE
ncbi:hypothetical protein J6590_042923 [Homalodisca vitripennis]|nr:hypothetical protein J6590_042923 [Homalodisca vitripennis]